MHTGPKYNSVSALGMLAL